MVKFKGEKQSEGFKDNEKGKKSTLIEIDKPYFGDNEKNSKDNDLKEEKLVLEKNIKINEISERMLKLKKKIDLNLDHIEEMPVNYECSSKRIDLIDATLEEMFEENPLIDSIKENNSDDKIPPNNSRHKLFKLLILSMILFY